MSETGKATPRWVAALALVPTPLLAFVSPALQLYLGNQEDLYYQSSVVLPFVGLALASVALGALLWALSSSPVFRFLTWTHLMCGVFLLSYRFLGAAASELPALVGLAVSWTTESALGIGLWCVGWLGTSLVAARRFAPSSIAKAMAAFALVLIAGDALTFVNANVRPADENGLALGSVSVPETVGGVNVYHVVLDALQTEVFELLRSPELDAELGGFVYFPANRAVYHSTVMSLGSMFTSRRYRYDEPRARYIGASFHERSIMRRFSDAGYWTLALVPSSDPIRENESGFENVVHHMNNFERSSAMNATAFRNLFAVANVPPILLDRIISSGWVDERTRGELRLTRAGRALTDSAPVASAMSFRELGSQERRLPDAGRYTFVHLLIPHSPYVLREDCSFEEWERSEDPLAQTRCTLSLLSSFLEELDRLGRFESSLVLVHGDHGAPFRTREGALVRARARSLATPLLIKPPGRGRDDDLKACRGESSLLDVAPTVLDVAGFALDAEFEGVSLKAKLESCN